MPIWHLSLKQNNLIMTFKKIVRTFALTSLLTLTAHSANAQDLLARQAPIDRRAKALDTMVINRLREAEEIEEPSWR